MKAICERLGCNFRAFGAPLLAAVWILTGGSASEAVAQFIKRSTVPVPAPVDATEAPLVAPAGDAKQAPLPEAAQARISPAPDNLEAGFVPRMRRIALQQGGGFGRDGFASIAEEDEVNQVRVASLAISADGRYACTGNENSHVRYNQFSDITTLDSGFFATAKLWDLQSGRELRRFVGHKNCWQVRSVAISPDSSLVATTANQSPPEHVGVIPGINSLGMETRLWSLESGEQLKLWKENAVTVSFSHDGAYLFAAGERSFTLIETRGLKTIKEFPSVSDCNMAPLGSRDLCTFLGAGRTGLIRFNYLKQTLQREYACPDVIWAYDFDEEEALVAGVGGKRLYLWDANTGQLLRSFTSDQGEFDGLNASAGLSPQGTVAWGVTTSGHYQAWDIATGRSLGSYALGLGAFAVHPTQRYGLHGNGHLLDVVEPETGVRLVRMHQHEVERDWMAQSIDGMVIQSDQRRANTLLDERFKDAQIREDADAVQRRLSALLAPDELWQADAAVHAEVTILASRADGHELAVAVPDWPAEMPILRVVTMVDGVLLPFGGVDPTSAEPGLANWNRKLFVRVKNPGQQTEVVLQVQTSDAATKPVKLTLVASDKNPTLHSGRLFVLVIGVGEHRYPEYNLQYAGADAREIAIFFRTQRAVQYSEILVTQLSDAEASRVAILQALREIAGTAGPEDVALVFFAGHGTRGKRGLYFVPHEGDAEGINHTCVNWEDVATELNTFKSRQTIVWLDCCHSGQLLAKPDGIQREIAEQLLSNARICVMAASKGEQFALEDRSWGHGAFTLALLEALGGGADSDKNLSITMGEVAMYLTKRVAELTKNAQEPEISPLSEEASRVTIARTTD